MDGLHTMRNFSDGVAALPGHDRPDGTGDVDDETFTAPTTETEEDAALMDMALSRLASDGEPIPAEKVHEDLGIDLDEIDAMNDVELSESTRQMATAAEDKEYRSMTTDEMQRLINQQMREGKSWPQALEALAEVLGLNPFPRCSYSEVFWERDEYTGYKSYVSFPSGTEITYSRLRDDGSVGVWVETPVDGGFKSAHCCVPAFLWDKIEGYDNNEMADLDGFVHDNAPLILRMAKEDAEEEKKAREAAED